MFGGTGLYINCLVYNIEFKEEDFDINYREKLKVEAEENLEKLYNMALEIDPIAMEKISRNDKKRIMRVLEIYNSTGMTKTEQDMASRENGVKYDYRVFAINMNRQLLYDRINQRVDLMINQGLIKEVETLLNKYTDFPTAMQGLRI